MDSMGIPNLPSGLELTIATPGSGAGLHHISSSSASDDNNGSNDIENAREELALLDTFGREAEVDAQQHIISAATENRRPVDGSSSFQRRRYNRLSREQCSMLEASFQQNHSPDKGTKLDLADTLKLTLKQVQVWFVNRRSRFRKHEMDENGKELDSYKRQIESLTNETDHLRRKLKKLKKKLNKLKLKQAASMAPPAAEEEQQQQKQVIYVPILAGLLTNGEQSGATTAATTASFITHQGSVSATAGLPVVTNALLLPSPGGSNI